MNETEIRDKDHKLFRKIINRRLYDHKKYYIRKLHISRTIEQIKNNTQFYTYQVFIRKFFAFKLKNDIKHLHRKSVKEFEDQDWELLREYIFKYGIYVILVEDDIILDKYDQQYDDWWVFNNVKQYTYYNGKKIIRTDKIRKNYKELARDYFTVKENKVWPARINVAEPKIKFIVVLEIYDIDDIKCEHLQFQDKCKCGKYIQKYGFIVKQQFKINNIEVVGQCCSKIWENEFFI